MDKIIKCIDLSNIKTKNDHMNWTDSVGAKIPFVYDDISGEINLIDYKNNKVLLEYLIDLIEYIRPKKVVCNYGNHDKRFANYFAKNLDTDILELMPDTSLELIFVDGFKHYDKRSKSKIWYEPLAVEITSNRLIQKRMILLLLMANVRKYLLSL